MSETRLRDSARSRRSEIRTSAADWFARAHSGDWSSADQEQLDAWLAQSLSHRAAYWRLEGAWTEAARLAVLQPSGSQTPTDRRPGSPAAIKLAASVVIAAIVGVAGYIYLSAPGTQSYATAIGGHRSFTLSDGSRIELNTDTAIRIAATAGQRKVWLDKGEAYFQINHDAAHPFSVIADGQRITDLGTKFLVRQDGARLEVVLLEGRARLESMSARAQSRSTDLLPGDVATASADTMTVTRKSTRALANELGWRKGVLVFEGTSLADAAAQMNRYNAEKLVIADPAVARRSIDGTFPVHAVSEFAEMAQAVFGLRVDKQGDQTLISR